MTIRFLPGFFIFGILLSSCSSAPQESTLADLDVVDPNNHQHGVFVPPKSEEEIKAAYYAYMSDANTDDRARLVAINRLADLEIAKAVSALKQTKNETEVDELYRESLQTSLVLLKMALRDYPDEPSNDRILYRLARINDQLGNSEESTSALNRLAHQYPTSEHYAEAQFRLAEKAFLGGDFVAAEDAYTEVIYAMNNSDFLARAYFKRGWARYKQSLYEAAAQDHVEAIRQQNFEEYDQLEDNERRIFDEHYRALALDFANLPRFEALQSLFAAHETDSLYHTCRLLSDIYLFQERYSDAADVLQQFVTYHPQDRNSAEAAFKAADAWKQGGFYSRYLASIDSFYAHYAPGSDYWEAHDREAEQEIPQIREHILQVASRYHRLALNGDNAEAVTSAVKWYERYLQHFNGYARQDKVHILYGDLLSAAGDSTAAVAQYEAAAFDNTLILDKTAAYAAITLLAELSLKDSGNKAWLDKYLAYAQRYAQYYSTDNDVVDLVRHAAGTAFDEKRFDAAIDLSNSMPMTAANDAQVAVRLIKARSLLQLDQLLEAEETLSGLVESPLSDQDRRAALDSLALVIYRRGSAAEKDNNVERAVIHYARIAELAPASPIAAQGLYDAAVLAMDHKLWPPAVTHLETFQQKFPKHKQADDVMRRLSVAYLEAKQYTKAAKALEDVSGGVEDAQVQMASLWKAAELYEQEGDLDAAIRSYRTYAHAHKRPYPQFMEAMYKLTVLYSQRDDDYRRNFWEQKIFEGERSAPTSIKNARTDYIAAVSRLAQARRAHDAFETIQLVEPLAQNLRKKKQQMEEAIQLYSDASSYNISDVATESTFAIANIYRSFARELLASERPRNLSGPQLAQYEILIEDQAFPFEEMAVEFHEINMSRVGQGTVNQWVLSSLDELRSLFPVRYNRRGRAAIYQPTQADHAY